MACRAVLSALTSVEEHVLACVSRGQTLLNGNGIAGTPATPNRGSDLTKKWGIWIKNGEDIKVGDEVRKRYHLQFSKDAENPTIKKLANKDPSKKWSYADIVINPKVPVDGEVALKQFFTDLRNNIVD
ncbi:hypothetical protein N7481_009167 [Penicillium waksmanii]|uniref:uncharacterized protein n=1 Tax=Penicillium waksmanii TaxID=69791 RepID=UPI002546D1E6|nr:uncharacterized protein N7481_009167 [Penicillium waksmanii]KAJ5975460.1 hypothetical protein N7481_009167 [Penicillium waksmanii]